ncbi:DUF6434 domain-containing protein [Spirosoma endophyticum]|uniref:DUF6434 domain-containing protein n=1 Tax=Spirosoma endophyticum TaxID=662367 RepID=A0A1I2HH85_9BACT|nr:DUF6434 domain-containing protein [Spirosoma endophyticum]SFF28783.1 hypothetical protein SAMN05216167_14313 [Spirosoma endophyticum]
MKRPFLTPLTPVTDFLAYYWLKQELVDFCRAHGLKTTGSKVAITDRIAQWLRTGQPPLEPITSKRKPGSAGPLLVALDAPITTRYTSGNAVRAFFTLVIGPHFHFTVGLMKFCKENPTKTFGDAVQYWQAEQLRKVDTSLRSEIGPQFEYNQYIRDFRADNPGASLPEAIACWKIKRSKRGDNRYSRADLTSTLDE